MCLLLSPLPALICRLLHHVLVLVHVAANAMLLLLLLLLMMMMIRINLIFGQGVSPALLPSPLFSSNSPFLCSGTHCCLLRSTPLLMYQFHTQQTALHEEPNLTRLPTLMIIPIILPPHSGLGSLGPTNSFIPSSPFLRVSTPPPPSSSSQLHQNMSTEKFPFSHKGNLDR